MERNYQSESSRRQTLKSIARISGIGVVGTGVLTQTAGAVDDSEKVASEVNTWYRPSSCTNPESCRQEMVSQNTNIMWRGVSSVEAGYRYRDLHHFTVFGCGSVRKRIKSSSTGGEWGDWRSRRNVSAIDAIGFEIELTGDVPSARIDFDHSSHSGVVAAGVPQADATTTMEFLGKEIVITLATRGVAKLAPKPVKDEIAEFAYKRVGRHIADRFFPDIWGSHSPSYSGEYVSDEWTIDDVDSWFELLTTSQQANDLDITLDFVVEAPSGTDVDDLGLKARTYVEGGPRRSYDNEDTGHHGATKVFNTTTSDEIPIGM